jgi:molybdopterin-guanine dinucleotide biosynthesis protein A
MRSENATAFVRLGTRFIEFNEIAELEGSADSFINVNNPEDYATAATIDVG